MMADTESMAAKLLTLVFVLDQPHKRVLLGRKKRGFGEGKFNGFGGKVEPGETLRSCAARELAEEAGLVVDAADLARRGVLTFNMLADGMVGADGRVSSRLEVHVYSCALEQTGGAVAESDEMAPAWWPFDGVPFERMWEDDRHWLPEVLNGNDVCGDFIFQDQATIIDQTVRVLPREALQRAEERLRRLRVDHLVFGVPGTLEEACAAFYERTGVRPAVGGVHKGLGTHNALVALGGPDDGSRGGSCGYFEILALDPEQREPERLWMAMETVAARGEARIVTWASDRGGELELAVEKAKAEHSYEAGAVRDFARTTEDGRHLKWKLAYRHYNEAMLPADGIVPFLIAWDPACHDFTPAITAPQGCELISLKVDATTDPAATTNTLAAVGIDASDLEVPSEAASQGRLIATLRTPRGLVEF
jgi:8-oxo-dGTP pyrophosphatase MutT (NUDIX family)